MAAVALTVAGCGLDGRTRLDVRTDLAEPLRSSVERSFEAAHPDIDVRFTVEADETTRRELAESNRLPFDVWWGAPAPALHEADRAGLLRATQPGWADEDGAWHAILVTPFVIAFNRDEVTLALAPADWRDLLHFRWDEEVAMLDPERSATGAWFMGSVLADAIRRYGDAADGMDWLRRMEERVSRYVPDTPEALRDLRLARSRIALLPRAAVETEARSADGGWLHYRIPESGTALHLVGVGVARSTEVPEAAAAFLEHVGSEEVMGMAEEAGWLDPGSLQLEGGEEGEEARLVASEGWSAWPLDVDDVLPRLDGWLEEWGMTVRGTAH